jgi:cell wall-associated NlpC family hydrolase
MHKRFISISTVVLIMTSSSAAFGQMIQSNTAAAEQTTATQVTQVTKPVEPITSPVVKQETPYSGAIRTSTLAIGPVFSSDPPVVGSIDWLQQQEAEKLAIKAKAATKEEELEAEIARLEKIAEDTKNLNTAIAATKKYVGKTWYAHGGSTPDAWDCSGLVLWTYAHLGINLYHSASVQKDSGPLVTKPKIGDIVAFTFAGSTRAFHTAIYTGPDEMLHSGGKRGDRTEITSISRWAKGNGNVEVTYTRIVETNN